MTELPMAGYRSCVGILLVNREGRIFVGERLDTPGGWQMPQGGIDKGEEPLAAGLRELEEETGITTASILAISNQWRTYDLPDKFARKSWQGRYRGQTQIWLAVRFNGKESEINLQTAEPEFTRWKWTDPGTLVREVIDFKRKTYRGVLEEFARFIAS